MYIENGIFIYTTSMFTVGCSYTTYILGDVQMLSRFSHDGFYTLKVAEHGVVAFFGFDIVYSLYSQSLKFHDHACFMI